MALELFSLSLQAIVQGLFINKASPDDNDILYQKLPSINQSPHSWSRTGYISRALHFSQLTSCFPIQDGRMDQFLKPCSSLHNILSHKSTPKTEDSRFECSAALSSAWPLASDKSSSAVNQISHIPNNPLQ